jgi:Bacterial regulatory helix-turn-helix protein, lysR family
MIASVFRRAPTSCDVPGHNSCQCAYTVDRATPNRWATSSTVSALPPSGLAASCAAISSSSSLSASATRLAISSMSQSPLSRAIRELERDLGLVLFVRTTRRVELTPAGEVLLERSPRALTEIDGTIADARLSANADDHAVAIGYAPVSGSIVSRIVEALGAERPICVVVPRRR